MMVYFKIVLFSSLFLLGPCFIHAQNEDDSLFLKLEEAAGIEKGQRLYNVAVKAYQGGDTTVLDLIYRAVNYNKNFGFEVLYLNSLNLLANFYKNNGELEKTILVCDEALNFANRNEIRDDVWRFYTVKAFSYMLLYDFRSALETTDTQLEFGYKYKDTSSLILGFDSKARFLWKLKRYEQAAELGELAYDLAEISDFRNKLNILQNLALYYSEFNQKKSLEVFKKVKFYDLSERQRASVNVNLGTAYFDMDSLDVALVYLDSAFNYYQHHPNEVIKLSSIYYYKGEVFFAKSDFKKSLHFLNLAEALSVNKFVYKEELIYKLKAQIFDTLNNQDSAYFYLVKYLAVKDTILKKDETSILAIKESEEALIQEEEKKKFLLKEKRILAEELKLEQSKNKWVIFGLIISVFFVVLLVGFLIQYRKSFLIKRRLIKLKHRQELELKDKQLITLKIQRENRAIKVEEVFSNLAEIKDLLTEKGTDNEEVSNKIMSISDKIDFDSDQDWNAFKLSFEEINEGFFNALLDTYPSLSQNDEKLCAYLKLNMDSKQISRLLNVQPDTVAKQRHRLRKKMNLPKNAVIREYLKF